LTPESLAFALEQKRLYNRAEHFPYEGFRYKHGFFPTMDEDGELVAEGWLARNSESYFRGEQQSVEDKLDGKEYGAAHMAWCYMPRLNTDIHEVDADGALSQPRVSHDWSRCCAALCVARNQMLRDCREVEGGKRHFFDFKKTSNRPPRNYCDECGCPKCAEISLEYETADETADES
jgi:hypothetical protein